MSKNKTQKNIHGEWLIKNLDELATISRGGSPRPIESYITKEKDGLNWLRIGDVDPNAKYIYRTNKRIRKEGLSKTTLVNSGDFILSNSMSFGRPYIMQISACIHDGWLALREIKTDLISKEFLYYLLSSKKIQNIFISISAGSGVQNLKKETVSSVSVRLPLIDEQNRIVAVLEAWDGYLEKLSKKIEVKKKVKKGLMQKLLSGRERLKGFSGEWRKVQLGKLLNYEQPTNYIVKSTEYDNKNNIPVLTAGKTFILGYTDEKEGIFKEIDLPVIIFDDFTTANKFVDFPFKVKSSAMKILKNKDENVSNIDFIFNSIQLLRFIVGEHKRNYLSEYQYLDIGLPDIKEQTAIAQILTTADLEIETLEKKKKIIEDQKKYLLNNLVTGKIRVSEFSK